MSRSTICPPHSDSVSASLRSRARGRSIDQDVGYSTVAPARHDLTPAFVVPHASAAWQHAFDDVTPEAALAFASTGFGFTMTGAPRARQRADRLWPRLRAQGRHDPCRLLLRPDRLRLDRQRGQRPLQLAVLSQFLRLRPRRMALGKARQAPLQQRKVPAMPAREAKAAAGDGEGGRRRRRSIPASTRALPATASSPSRASMVIASRRRERLRQFQRAVSMAWSERPPTATARRTQNCWAGTARTTPRRVTAGSRRTQILKLVPVPRKSLLARCARAD